MQKISFSAFWYEKNLFKTVTESLIYQTQINKKKSKIPIQNEVFWS